jgi:hypothetical protein
MTWRPNPLPPMISPSRTRSSFLAGDERYTERNKYGSNFWCHCCCAILWAHFMILTWHPLFRLFASHHVTSAQEQARTRSSKKSSEKLAAPTIMIIMFQVHACRHIFKPKSEPKSMAGIPSTKITYLSTPWRADVLMGWWMMGLLSPRDLDS